LAIWTSIGYILVPFKNGNPDVMAIDPVDSAKIAAYKKLDYAITYYYDDNENYIGFENIDFKNGDSKII
jgi:hypothetical protein